MRLNGVQRLLEAGIIISTFSALFILCALISFDPADPSWSQTGEFVKVKNITGSKGAWIADILLFSFGWLAFSIPVVIQGLGYLFFKEPHRIMQLDYLTLSLRVVGFVFFVTTATAISSINFDDIYYFSSGGVVGDIIANAMLPAFNFTGTSILLLCFFFAGLTLLTGVSWVQFVDTIGEYTVKAAYYCFNKIRILLDNRRSDNTYVSQSDDEVKRIEEIDENKKPVDKSINSENNTFPPVPQPDDTTQRGSEITSELSKLEEFDDIFEQDMSFSAIDDEPIDTASALNSLDNAAPITNKAQAYPTVNPAEIQVPLTAKDKFEALLKEKTADQKNMPALPTMDLLDRPDKAKNPISPEELEAVSRLVEVKLLDFGVQAQVVGVFPGPVVTRFELDLAPGIKVAKISGLSKDLARSLSAVSVRVVEVIPGKTYIGIELPNKHREVVKMSEVIDAGKFLKSSSALAMVLGKDIAGEPVVVDLSKMPHLLVAGTTGSGKSVGVNVMIVSLLYKSSPEDVRLIMIDPKMLELSVYEGIPHLLCEVVTDMKEAANALRWCVGEMERRYKLMSALGVRNLNGYNQKVSAAIAAGTPIKDPLFKASEGMAEEASDLEKLPSIVVVIDEFADMMMIVGKKVEELIARIAQKARAAGIHLVLATQRPSVDVITGLIKANIPTRMAFQVSSKIDSRTILDQQGAENLLGMGDMLYLPPGTSVPVRVHGAFIDDHEVHAVVNDWKMRGKPAYIDEILNGDSNEEILLPGETSEEDDAEQDPLYDEAVSFVLESKRASISSVQRKLRVGYNRAARLIEQMESSGIVSAPGHNGAREILVPNAAG